MNALIDDRVELETFPEYGLRTRTRLIASWIPQDCTSLLDAGCSYGHSTRVYRAKTSTISGVDPNVDAIALARRRSAELDFRVSAIEQTPYEDESFQVVVLADVLEHVSDERAALDEIFRVLAVDGVLILTVPHKGFFGWIDVDNLVILLRRLAPAFYAALYRLKEKTDYREKPGYNDWHRHYTLAEMLRLIDGSAFAGRYRILKEKRCGLILEALTGIIVPILTPLFGKSRAVALNLKARRILNAEYDIPFGRFAYNLALSIQKTGR